MTLNYTEECVLCHGPWHPVSGQLVGSPVEFKVCGACFRQEIIPLIRSVMGRKEKNRRISFYEIASRRGNS